MVSRVGKQFDEKLNSQKLLDAIANPSNKLTFRNRHKKTKLLPPDEVIALLDRQEHASLRPKVVRLQEKHTADFMFSRQSRQDYYQSKVRCIQRVKDSVPPPGYYSPNFAPVQRTDMRPVKWEKQSSEEKERRFDEGLKRFGSHQSYPIRSIVTFDKQLARRELTYQSPSPHEQRFTVHPEALLHPKSHRISTTDMSKSLPRPDLFTISDAPNPDYHAHYEAIWPPVARKLDFKKTSGRKALQVPVNDLIYENISYDQVLNRIQSPDFARMGLRPALDESPFPLFMRSLSSWQGLRGLSEKSLRLSGAIGRESVRSPGVSVMGSGGDRSPFSPSAKGSIQHN